MAALDTVQAYVSAARDLLQDTDAAPNYRHSDAKLVRALSHAMIDARKLRPDLFIGRMNAVPSYTANDGTAVVFDQQYRTALLNYMVGLATISDDEPTQDQRGASFLAAFRAALTTLQA